jgi:transposase
MSVTTTADPVVNTEPGPVTVFVIDETRRGKAKYETCERAGKRIWIDRFDTGIVDITGTGGLPIQVNGRSAAPVTDWLGERGLARRESITHAMIDMSVTCAKAVRDALPHAQLVVDRYRLVKRANQIIETVRRRTTWQSRGRKADPERLARRRPLRGAERLTEVQRTRLIAALDARRRGSESRVE